MAEARGPAVQRVRPTTVLVAEDPQRLALFLDVDGTLVDIAATPDSVIVRDGLIDIMRRLLTGLDGALAVITGRRIADIDRLLAPLKLVAAGVHGAELRVAADGGIRSEASTIPADLIGELERVVAQVPGTIGESKGAGFALHYRMAPAAKPLLEAELQRIIATQQQRVRICPGRKVFEILPPGHSKGTALESLAALPPFRGRIPVMIGDDSGDEPAFAAARDRGGFGFKVAGEQFHRDDADFESPADVFAWLERLADRLGQSLR